MTKLPEDIKDRLYDINKCGVKLARWVKEVEKYLMKRGYDMFDLYENGRQTISMFEHGCGDIEEFEKVLIDIYNQKNA